jgi:methionyl-tRNA formyltransferase
VVDTPGWFDGHARRLVERVIESGDTACLLRSYGEIEKPDVVFYLSCTKIAPPEALIKAKINLIAHASELPRGRGFSPAVWQVLEGAAVIPIKLIHAAETVDSGDIVLSDSITLEGHELNDEIRAQLGARVVELCLTYLASDAPPQGQPQQGEPTWYPRRVPEDSMLDPQRSIAEQFDVLRVVDNSRYPAFFELRGHRYLLRIEKASTVEDDDG